jgi:hypothetical protein
LELKQHKTLTVEKWASFSFGKQILMIANELNRAKNWIKKKDYIEVRLCYERAFELLYLTISNVTKRSRRLELIRLKEVLAELYSSDHYLVNKNSQLYNVTISLSSESYNMLNPVGLKS